jgi:NDP-sugar pyrophosphorylase family protein
MLGIILSAGSEPRTGYLGGILPRTMVPVGGQPLLWHELRSLSLLGVTDARVAVNPGTGIIDQYVQDMNPEAVGLRSIRLVKCSRPTSTPVESLVSALREPPSNPFAVVLGDDLTVASNLPTFLPRFEASGAYVAEAVVPEGDTGSIRRTNEICLKKDGWISGIHERPRCPRWGWRGCGLYLFSGTEFSGLLHDAASSCRIRSMTGLVRAGMIKGRALGLHIRGRNINVNTVLDLLLASQLYPQDLKDVL